MFRHIVTTYGFQVLAGRLPCLPHDEWLKSVTIWGCRMPFARGIFLRGSLELGLGRWLLQQRMALSDPFRRENETRQGPFWPHCAMVWRIVEDGSSTLSYSVIGAFWSM